MAVRDKALSKMDEYASRIKRSLLELAIACNVDPEDLVDELSGARTPLTSQNFIDMQTKLVAWIDREDQKMLALKTKAQAIPLP